MGDGYENRLTYEQVIMNHINRCSIVLSRIDEMQLLPGNVVKERGESLKTTFGLCIRFLMAMIPDNYKDKTYKEGIEKNKDLDGFQWSFGNFQVCINLMMRHNMLMAQKEISYIPKANRGIEFWEDGQ